MAVRGKNQTWCTLVCIILAWLMLQVLNYHSEFPLLLFIKPFHCMRCHIQKTVANCFAVLRQLRSIRRSVPTSVYHTLVVALVLSRLDYGNAVLVVLPAYLYNRLQSASKQITRHNLWRYRKTTGRVMMMNGCCMWVMSVTHFGVR